MGWGYEMEMGSASEWYWAGPWRCKSCSEMSYYGGGW
jgi:hypothetical protein